MRDLEMPGSDKRTSRRQREELETERDRLTAILNSMDDGIYIVGKDYRIQFMNLALRSEMGNGEGRLCHEFFGHDPSHCEHCQHGISSFGPEHHRECYLEATNRIYEMAVSTIHGPDGDISRLHILRDITERKNMEAQLHDYSRTLEAKVAEQAEKLLRQERLALLGEISAGIAHELRTPLGAIITGVKLLEKGAQPPKEKELIFGLLKRETARLERKISEFLSYAKPRMPRPTQTYLPSFFEEIRAVLATDRKLLGDATINMTLQPGLTTWPVDTDQIKEALLNICTNALHALGGSGTLTIEVKSFYQGVLEIFVRDNGPGIPKDALPHIFKPFYSRRTGGTGLGLAISKEIIESHGGHISVTSIPKLITSFRITIPWPKNAAPPTLDG
jgi:two-component system, NtrC family, sensor histidine kinase HydH